MNPHETNPQHNFRVLRITCVLLCIVLTSLVGSIKACRAENSMGSKSEDTIPISYPQSR